MNTATSAITKHLNLLVRAANESRVQTQRLLDAAMMVGDQLEAHLPLEVELPRGYRRVLLESEFGFRTFLRKNPSDKLAPDAHYWMGESLFQRQRYQDAADAYLVVVCNYESAEKAPDSLLRLGQSLAAIGQKEMACASLGEVPRKYPRASAKVKSATATEQKRIHC